MVQEVLRGRHTEILGQLNAKLEDPPKPPKPPLQPVSVQLKEQSHSVLEGLKQLGQTWQASHQRHRPPCQGLLGLHGLLSSLTRSTGVTRRHKVLVVTEEWRPSRNGSKSDAKKVALTTDDTDAKSAGDDSRSHLSDDSGVLKRGASGAQSAPWQ